MHRKWNRRTNYICCCCFSSFYRLSNMMQLLQFISFFISICYSLSLFPHSLVCFHSWHHLKLIEHTMQMENNNLTEFWLDFQSFLQVFFFVLFIGCAIEHRSKWTAFIKANRMSVFLPLISGHSTFNASVLSVLFNRFENWTQ